MNKRIVIIPAERTVIVDNVGEELDVDLELDASIHVVQWYNDHGWIEYLDGRPNEDITNFGEFAKVITKYNEYVSRAPERQKALEAETERLNAEAEIEAKKTRTWWQNRLVEYPSVGEQLEALMDARKGDDTKLIEIDAKFAEIKAKYPKDPSVPLNVIPDKK